MTVERPPRDRSVCTDTDDLAMGTLTCVRVENQGVAHCYRIHAGALCFVRGTGKIAIDGTLVDYAGKWFDIPKRMEYRIIPETDTVILNIKQTTKDPLECQ